MKVVSNNNKNNINNNNSSNNNNNNNNNRVLNVFLIATYSNICARALEFVIYAEQKLLTSVIEIPNESSRIHATFMLDDDERT